nr:relaxase/mobilization nuclease domain-containing protein [Pseudoflavonifractor sp. 524-17]
MAGRHNYDQKPEKTLDGKLVSSYMCSPETAAEEFEISKKIYARLTGRSQSKQHDIIMYRVIQSFRPGEVSPEEANRIGYELAMKFTRGQHQFVVSTHVDKAHIHTHIEFNSTNLNCDGKFQNVKNSAFLLRKLNDELCRAHGLSVIERPKPRAKTQGEAAAAKYGVSFKERLRQTIDRVLPDCRSYQEFLANMRGEGYEVKEGKLLSFRAPGQERFTRSNRLGAEYTREALEDRFVRQGGRNIGAKPPAFRNGRSVNLLIDIQAKMAAGKGAGYQRWAKVFNLKEAAKTLNFLTEHGLTDYDALAARAEQAGKQFDEASRRIKQLEGRMAGTAQLKTHIINYAKTREVYTAYKKSRHKKEFLAEYGDEIARHEAAKRAFDALNGKPIPKVAQLSKQYAALLAEKQERYAEYRDLRRQMLEYRTAKQNVDRILGLEPAKSEQLREAKPER